MNNSQSTAHDGNNTIRMMAKAPHTMAKSPHTMAKAPHKITNAPHEMKCYHLRQLWLSIELCLRNLPCTQAL